MYCTGDDSERCHVGGCGRFNVTVCEGQKRGAAMHVVLIVRRAGDGSVVLTVRCPIVVKRRTLCFPVWKAFQLHASVSQGRIRLDK